MVYTTKQVAQAKGKSYKNSPITPYAYKISGKYVTLYRKDKQIGMLPFGNVPKSFLDRILAQSLSDVAKKHGDA